MNEIENGCFVKFKPDYHDDPNEIFRVSQWDGNKGWAESEDGGGWYFTASQVTVTECPHSRVDVFTKKIASATRYEPAEIDQRVQCRDCGEELDEIPRGANERNLPWDAWECDESDDL